MERVSSSLELRVPPSLLPSTAAPQHDDSFGEAAPANEDSQASSVASELRGLTLRPISHYSRSTSGSTPQHSPPQQRDLHRSATGPADGQRALVQQGGSQATSPSAPAAVAPPPAEQFAQRVYSRRLSASTAPAVPGGALLDSASAPSTNSHSQIDASHSASPERYSDDEFEAEDDSRGQQTAGTSPTASSIGVNSSFGQPASTLHSGHTVSAAGRQLSRSGSSRLGGYMSSTAASAKRSASAARPCSRPGSASPCKQPARPASAGRPALEARVMRQMERDPADWGVSEVVDWLELVGLGQYRRRFVHHAISGTLLLQLSAEELKARLVWAEANEVSIGPLGHREGLLTAINDLEEYWQQRQAARSAPDGGETEGDEAWQIGAGGGGGSSAGGSRPGSPPLTGSGAAGDYSLQRVYAQRARLLRDLEKAEGREAHRKKAAEQALRVVGQASDEVRRLQASICELDRSLGRQDAAEGQRYDPLDVHGAVAWQPAGTRRAKARRPTSARPSARCGSPNGGGAMSPLSRRIMGGEGSGGSPGTFLDRLNRDIEARQAKAAEAARRAGRYAGGAEEEMAEREREARELRLVREAVEARDDELAAALGSSEPARVAQACDEVSDTYQQELGLSDEAVAAVKKAGSPARKAARLAAALRSSQFMSRLQHDLSTREMRLQELQNKFIKMEQGAAAEQQEKADQAAAQAHFAGLLGWPQEDLAAVAEAPSADTAPGTDELLAALLRRAAALQEARLARGKSAVVDWEQAGWKKDRLEDLQAQHNASLAAAVAEQQAAAAAEAAAQASGKRGWRPLAAHKELPQPGEHLRETVELLAACRPAEVALLEGLGGYKKLLMTWRAIRGQKFVAFTRRDLEHRCAKAAELERQLYPDTTRRLPKEEFDAFFDRLMADTARRTQNREELAEKAKAETLAKLMKTAPTPPSHRRPGTASNAAPA